MPKDIGALFLASGAGSAFAICAMFFGAALIRHEMEFLIPIIFAMPVAFVALRMSFMRDEK